MGDALLRILPYVTTLAAALWAVYLHRQRQTEAQRDEIAEIEVARIKAMGEREARLFQHQDDMAQATLAEIARLRTLVNEVEQRDIGQRAMVEELSERLFKTERDNEKLRAECDAARRALVEHLRE